MSGPAAREPGAHAATGQAPAWAEAPQSESHAQLGGAGMGGGVLAEFAVIAEIDADAGRQGVNVEPRADIGQQVVIAAGDGERPHAGRRTGKARGKREVALAEGEDAQA